MKLHGIELLEEFKRDHADARDPLNTFRIETEKASWSTPQDIKQRHGSADFLSDCRVIINIIWIGTHAEYDKKKF